MVMVQFDVSEAKMMDALEALKGIATGSPKLFAVAALPKLPSENAAFEKRALEIAKTIKPRDSQPMRLEALRVVLTGHDTFWDQKGEPNSALRNATGALSKALRKFALYDDSPIEILCERRREVFSDGPGKGQYKGTRYVPTPLGRRVCEILREWNVI